MSGVSDDVGIVSGTYELRPRTGSGALDDGGRDRSKDTPRTVESPEIKLETPPTQVKRLEPSTRTGEYRSLRPFTHRP